MARIVRLLQVFDGSCHVMIDGVVVKFSLTLQEAIKWAIKNGYELR
jgi:hypothetical protein